MIKKRLADFRKAMKAENISYYIIPTTDYHQSEYVSDFFKAREYFSGFTGSNGTLVIEEDRAGLWTDGRYFVQAEIELKGSGITLFKMNEKDTPDILSYLKERGKAKERIGIDGKLFHAEYVLNLKETFTKKGMEIVTTKDIVSKVWSDRPALPCESIRVLETKLCGEGVEEKKERLLCYLEKQKATAFFLTKLDDIMWLFNIRGGDVAYNPVALSYAWISEAETVLFLQEKVITEELKTYAYEAGFSLRNYEEITIFLNTVNRQEHIFLDKQSVSSTFYEILQERATIIDGKNPTELMKAIKNPTEIANLKNVYRQDSVAVTKFLYWMKKREEKIEITEKTAAEYMDLLRQETEGFLDLSFPTISAYGANAAMMHYSVNEECDTKIPKEGVYLIDSGGQYVGGTTDVTRTIILGKVPTNFKKHFTAVVSGMLQLQEATFMAGCTGKNLDILARQPIWELYEDYKCGTGHGIGYMLNVHEGPNSIRFRYPTSFEECILEPGMVTSNEPGIYKAGEYGIRIENILLCEEKAENEEGLFLGFVPLTFVPIDVEGIDRQYLTIENKKRLNDYHQKVYAEISPFLDEMQQQWLKEITLPL